MAKILQILSWIGQLLRLVKPKLPKPIEITDSVWDEKPAKK